MVTLSANAEGTDNNSLELGGYLMTPKVSYSFQNSTVYLILYGVLDFGVAVTYPLNKSKEVVGLLEVGMLLCVVVDVK